MWTTLSFKFPVNVLAAADKEAVFREFDQWLMPEGRATSAASAAPAAAPAITAFPATAPAAAAAPQTVAAPSLAAPRDSSLTPGMTREQILQALGCHRLGGIRHEATVCDQGLVDRQRTGLLSQVGRSGIIHGEQQC